ncbi:MAG: hypothetical protein ACE15D_05880 [Candidatus Eisenbacteria bacterium]
MPRIVKGSTRDRKPALKLTTWRPPTVSQLEEAIGSEMQTVSIPRAVYEYAQAAATLDHQPVDEWIWQTVLIVSSGRLSDASGEADQLGKKIDAFYEAKR